MENKPFNFAHAKLIKLLTDRPDSERLKLFEGIVLLAQGGGEECSEAKVLQQFSFMEMRLSTQISDLDSIALKVESMCHFMKNEMGFKGNIEEYYNPQNSFINQVLSTKRGIPISLACIYILLAQSIDLQIEGVGFPCHFLVREKQSGLLIDPFEHRIVSKQDCLRRLKSVLGKEVELREHYFNPVTSKQIIMRFLGNLKEIHYQKKNYEESLDYCQLILAVEANEINNLFDRAQLYEMLECYSAAIDDFKKFKELFPDDVRMAMVNRKINNLQSNSSFMVH